LRSGEIDRVPGRAVGEGGTSGEDETTYSISGNRLILSGRIIKFLSNEDTQELAPGYLRCAKNTVRRRFGFF
jgi:hypothetical protein